MKKCRHMTAAGHLRNKLSRIKMLLSDRGPESSPLRCLHCERAEDLLVSCECGAVLCRAHLFAPCESGHGHALFFDIGRDSLYCGVCDKYVAMPESETGKSLSGAGFDFFALKKTTDLGATSCISSVLQVFLNTRCIRDHFFGFHHPLQTCEIEGCADCFFKKLSSQIYSSAPVDLSEPIYGMLRRSEYYARFRADSLRDVFGLLADLYHPEAVPAAGCSCIMHRTFFGTLCTVERCVVCKCTASRTEQLVFLELELGPVLSSALTEFFAPCKTDEPLYCPACAKTVPAYLKRTMVRPPRVLSIYLNRAVDAGRRKKSCRVVVDDTVQVEGSRYGLYAFIVRKRTKPGSFNCFMLLGGRWFEFGQEKIIPNANVGPELPKATMLFYELKDDAAAAQASAAMNSEGPAP